MMKYFIFTLFLFFCLSCSHENKDDGIAQIPFGSEFSLDIITWNLETFPKHSNTIEYVADFIYSLNPDIIALQEISSTSQFNSLLNLLGDAWIGYQSESLAYLININNITITDTPYSILEEEEHYFAYRPPYVLDIEFLEEDGTPNQFKIIDVHFKCCGDGNLEGDYWDEEYRRLQANYYLKQHLDENFTSNTVIILGDFNDELVDSTNIFLNFLTDSDYEFSDMHIAEGPPSEWSFPNWPSHLDHILVYNQYSETNLNTQTLKLDNYLIGGWDKYDNYISDHRPIGINITFD